MVGDRGALLIPERTLLDPVAVEGPLTLNGWCCRKEAQVGRLLPTFEETPAGICW